LSLTCCHILLSVSDIDEAVDFYLTKLGLILIESYPKFFAVRAGDVRFSVFLGGKKRDSGNEEGAPAVVMLRTEDLDAKIAELKGRGVVFEGDVMEAPKFMRYISLLDPDGNQLYVAQYLGDPFVAS